MSGRTPQDFARATDPAARRFAGLVRRFAIAATTKILWRLTGVELPDGTEQFDAEIFGNIGFYSRPLAGKAAAPEAIVVNVGDARCPVVIATRDAKGQSKLLKDVAVGAGDTVIYSGAAAAIVLVRANGTVEVRAPGGAAVSLTKHAVITALKDIFDAWTPAAGDGGAALKTLLDNWDPGAGTTVLKGQ